MGQGVISQVERVIEQVVDFPSPTNPNPTIVLNCERSADLDLAVGPTRIVYTSNCTVRLVDPAAPAVALDEVYLRDNTDALSGAVGIFLPSISAGPGDAGTRFADPRVHWDPRNQRFWVVAVEVYQGSTNLCNIFKFGWLHIAVSKTSSPSSLDTSVGGDWWTYVFDLRSEISVPFYGTGDRPTINTDASTLHVALGRDLQLPTNTLICPGVVTAEPFDNQSVLITIPLGWMLSNDPPPPGLLPLFVMRLDPMVVAEDTAFHCAARTYDALPGPQIQYYLATPSHPQDDSYPVNDGLIIGQLDPDGAGGWTYSSQVLALPSAAWFYGGADAPLAPQPMGLVKAQGGPIFFSVVQRADSLWAVHSILRNAGGPNEPSPDPSGRTIARWYEITINNNGGFTLAQWGDIDPDEVYVNEPWWEEGIESFDPSISVNALGDFAITYTISGANTYPSMCIARRYRTSPTNTLPYHDVVRFGVATLNHTNHWSDFSGTEIDPSGCALWSHSMEAYDDGVTPVNPIDRYQSWTAKLDLCVDQDMWADFDGDA